MMIDLAEIVYNDLLTLGGGGIPIPQATKTAFEKLIASRAICWPFFQTKLLLTSSKLCSIEFNAMTASKCSNTFL